MDYLYAIFPGVPRVSGVRAVRFCDAAPPDLCYVSRYRRSTYAYSIRCHVSHSDGVMCHNLVDPCHHVSQRVRSPDIATWHSHRVGRTPRVRFFRFFKIT